MQVGVKKSGQKKKQNKTTQPPPPPPHTRLLKTTSLSNILVSDDVISTELLNLLASRLRYCSIESKTRKFSNFIPQINNLPKPSKQVPGTELFTEKKVEKPVA